MFEYVHNEYNPRPVLVLDTAARPVGKFVADLAYSTSLLLPLPSSGEALRELHSRKYWSKIRRYERRLDEEGEGLTFRVLTEEDALREALPRVQQLFAERWASEFTSLGWKTPAGFAPYADAMLRLAAQGCAELVVLEDGERLLSFAYCLRQDGIYYFYQHASTTAQHYRRHSVGKILVAKLIQDLVQDRRCEVLDFMTGASEYKREWSRIERPIRYRIEEDRTIFGALRFVARLGFYRTKFLVQFGHPRVRAVAKRVLLTKDRLVRQRVRRGADQPVGSNA